MSTRQGLRRACCALSAFAGVLLVAWSAHGVEPAAGAANSFSWTLRSRVRTAEGSPRFHQRREAVAWDASRTAFIVCDMWDLHHCLNATRRGGELTPRMNQVLVEARRRGALVIHAPSSCMPFYEGHPARRRALEAPAAANLPEEIGKWCYQIPAEEQGEYPIDQKNGGEDDDPQEHAEWAAKLAGLGLNPRAPWTRQTPGLEIRDEDVISDSGVEIWNVLESRQIDQVVVLGVHTNMCVLGRPFGLRQLARNGKRVVLMRDMTDTMYDPHCAPFVSHFTGTDLIVEHIEKWVCPTVTSDQLLGGKEFRFAGDQRPRLVIVTAEDEYRTEQTLPEFAAKQLGHDFKVDFVFANEAERNDLPGIELLNDADLLLLSVRRRVLPGEQLATIRRYLERGGPVVGIRTASHAFCLRNMPPPEGLADWPEFDAEILGGNYTNHHGNGPKVAVKGALAGGASEHPITAGIDLGALVGNGSLYKVSPLAPKTQTLLIGSIPEQPAEPVAWTHTTPHGGRVFYTSLGHWDDFREPAFQQLLLQGLRWAAAKQARE